MTLEKLTDTYANKKHELLPYTSIMWQQGICSIFVSAHPEACWVCFYFVASKLYLTCNEHKTEVTVLTKS